jgi:hypothetical protein
MDISIGELVLWAISAWILGQILLGISDAKEIVQLKERVETLKRIHGLIHQVKVEKQGEVEYWYDEDDNQFLGQGKTVDEVIEHVKARFPDHIFLIQGVGGVARQTDWKLLDVESFQKVELNVKDI